MVATENRNTIKWYVVITAIVLLLLVMYVGAKNVAPQAVEMRKGEVSLWISLYSVFLQHIYPTSLVVVGFLCLYGKTKTKADLEYPKGRVDKNHAYQCVEMLTYLCKLAFVLAFMSGGMQDMSDLLKAIIG